MKRQSILPALALILLVLPAAVFAEGFAGKCTGTYLIAEDGGARDFWTFAADGTFFGTTSTQPLLNFSNQQGSWERVSGNGGAGVLFAFVWNQDNTLLTTARVDITFAATGPQCDEITGSLVVRTFEDGEDPLDPATDTGDPIAEDTFTGRRVKAVR
jgi:hypothetical protein